MVLESNGHSDVQYSGIQVPPAWEQIYIWHLNIMLLLCVCVYVHVRARLRINTVYTKTHPQNIYNHEDYT
jgi:hypothetical protein